jgi:hypothetical protein
MRAQQQESYVASKIEQRQSGGHGFETTVAFNSPDA